ncbi:nitrilase/cyanide hydratase and apolipoprotein N-acyltransferase [Salmonella enterica subsp. enterica serovar Mbandaka]|nr:nitrilase/cyanide hydratase and apolipoprotein N-acyltransferase [Salmonella enterica subsp. enterica serovar Mbandaka]EED9866609.1 nitrilase/cyanide hydratase and apolipoprotein N-acyltransferase [Salmonella enterica subsp. enterica serovar Mbandaka]
MTIKTPFFAQELKKIRVAAVQAEPAFLDLDATTELACELIRQASEKGADLIAFPEAFVPSFPNWYESLWEGSLSRQFDKRLFLQSVEVPGTHINAIAEACGHGSINAVIGINERLRGTTGTMFNTQVHITRDGKIAGKHQKYVATTGERLVHGPGQTGHYNNFMTDFGPVSALICGENSNPLAQYAAALSYPVVHVASWPAYFGPFVPMHHVIHTASAGLAYSLKCFTVSAVSRISEEYINAVAIRDSVRDYLTDLREQRKGAMIFNPLGQLIACGDGDEENLLFADIDLNDVLIPKMVQDTAGHYNRPELFAELFRRD